jgi:Tfp pilus assembly protein PilX
MKRQAQAGITLVVSLIMLIVLTLLVVSAIRFGNINLRIAANAQFEAEAVAATRVALEQMVAAVDVAPKIDAITAVTKTISTGGKTYNVAVTKPACILTKNVNSTELDATKAADRVCFEGNDVERQVQADFKLTKTPTACKDQQWDVGATLEDADSGAKVSMLQGVAVRVGAEIQCP